MSATELHNLSVMFRTNDPNLGHVDTLDAMTKAGLAYVFGVYRGTPESHKRKRENLRETIAQTLEWKAKL